MCLCVCLCMNERVCVCVCACVFECVCMWRYECVRVCERDSTCRCTVFLHQSAWEESRVEFNENGRRHPSVSTSIDGDDKECADVASASN